MAGPNGSGKSSILRAISEQFYTGPYINADEIQKAFITKGFIELSEFQVAIQPHSFNKYLKTQSETWRDKSLTAGHKTSLRYSMGKLMVESDPSPYDAAMAADFIRNKLLEGGITFTFETVMSHHSKVEFLQQSKLLGFKNYLYFICTASPDINTYRVEQRVKLGGHDVPNDKIIDRYYRSLSLLPAIIPNCHRVYFFDNSTSERSIDPVATVEPDGSLKILAKEVPWWIREYVISGYYQK